MPSREPLPGRRPDAAASAPGLAIAPGPVMLINAGFMLMDAAFMLMDAAFMLMDAAAVAHQAHSRGRCYCWCESPGGSQDRGQLPPGMRG
jgi:hypothetical protein